MGILNVRLAAVLPAGPGRCSFRTEAAPFTLGPYRGPVLHGTAYRLAAFSLGLSGGLFASFRDRIPLSVDPDEAEPDPPPAKARIEPRVAPTAECPGEPAVERRPVRLRMVHAAIASAEAAAAGIDLTRFAESAVDAADAAPAWLALSGFAARGPFGVTLLAA